MTFSDWTGGNIGIIGIALLHGFIILAVPVKILKIIGQNGNVIQWLCLLREFLDDEFENFTQCIQTMKGYEIFYNLSIWI